MLDLFKKAVWLVWPFLGSLLTVGIFLSLGPRGGNALGNALYSTILILKSLKLWVIVILGMIVFWRWTFAGHVSMPEKLIFTILSILRQLVFVAWFFLVIEYIHLGTTVTWSEGIAKFLLSGDVISVMAIYFVVYGAMVIILRPFRLSLF